MAIVITGITSFLVMEKKRTEDLMEMLGLKETVVQMAMAI